MKTTMAQKKQEMVTLVWPMDIRLPQPKEIWVNDPLYQAIMVRENAKTAEEEEKADALVEELQKQEKYQMDYEMAEAILEETPYSASMLVDLLRGAPMEIVDEDQGRMDRGEVMDAMEILREPAVWDETPV